MCDPDTVNTYSSVVTRETVCIALILAALNILEFKAAVLNAYMMASNNGNMWSVLGSEFGNDAGKSAIIVRVLFGLKSACASFRAHLAQCMEELVYEFCKSYPDL